MGIDMTRSSLSVRFESIHDPPGGHTPGGGRKYGMVNRFSKGGNLLKQKTNITGGLRMQHDS